MVKILKPILMIFIKSKAMKRLVLDLLKAMVAKTDNDVDDAIVKMIEEKLFPVK